MELDEKTKQQIELINKSLDKFKEILQKEQGRKKDKFKNLGGDLLATANYFDKEIKKANAPAPKYHRYKYGSLVMVDYGLSIGDELCGNHFAIVLTNDDTPFNSTITVLPLTSKSGKNKLSLGELLSNMLITYQRNIINEITNNITKLNQEVKTINEDIKKIIIEKYGEEKVGLIFESEDYLHDSKINIPQDLVNRINNCIKKGSKYSKNYFKFNEVYERYQNKNRITYVITNQIKTISKFRILEPINEYDPITKILIPKETMLKIEKEIVSKYFTKAQKLNTPKVDKK